MVTYLVLVRDINVLDKRRVYRWSLTLVLVKDFNVSIWIEPTTMVTMVISIFTFDII